MASKILFVLSSQADLGAPGTVTGSWLEEIAAAYYVLVDAGHTVTFASVKGGEAPIDPMSLGDPWLTAAGKRFLADDAAQLAVKTTASLPQADLSSVDAVYFVGGAGTVCGFPPTMGLLAFSRRWSATESSSAPCAMESAPCSMDRTHSRSQRDAASPASATRKTSCRVSTKSYRS